MEISPDSTSPPISAVPDVPYNTPTHVPVQDPTPEFQAYKEELNSFGARFGGVERALNSITNLLSSFASSSTESLEDGLPTLQ